MFCKEFLARGIGGLVEVKIFRVRIGRIGRIKKGRMCVAFPHHMIFWIGILSEDSGGLVEVDFRLQSWCARLTICYKLSRWWDDADIYMIWDMIYIWYYICQLNDNNMELRRWWYLLPDNLLEVATKAFVVQIRQFFFTKIHRFLRYFSYASTVCKQI